MSVHRESNEKYTSFYYVCVYIYIYIHNHRYRYWSKEKGNEREKERPRQRATTKPPKWRGTPVVTSTGRAIFLHAKMDTLRCPRGVPGGFSLPFWRLRYIYIYININILINISLKGNGSPIQGVSIWNILGPTFKGRSSGIEWAWIQKELL